MKVASGKRNHSMDKGSQDKQIEDNKSTSKHPTKNEWLHFTTWIITFGDVQLDAKAAQRMFDEIAWTHKEPGNLTFESSETKESVAVQKKLMEIVNHDVGHGVCETYSLKIRDEAKCPECGMLGEFSQRRCPSCGVHLRHPNDKGER